MSTEFNSHLETYLAGHAFPEEERIMIGEFLNQKDESYEILPPDEVCRSWCEVLPEDQILLEASLSGQDISEFGLRAEVNEVLNGLGIEVHGGFFGENTLFLDTSLSYEQIVRDHAGINNALSKLAGIVGAKIFIKLAPASHPVEVGRRGPRRSGSSTRGEIEFTRACAKAILGGISTDHDENGIRIVVPPGRGSEASLALSGIRLKAPVSILERTDQTAHGSVLEVLPPAAERAVADLPPFILAALGLKPDESAAAVRPMSFFLRLNDYIEHYQERFPGPEPRTQEFFWATGEENSLHDDAWSINMEGPDAVLSLARPDPSFSIPQGGVVDCTARMLWEHVYTKTGAEVIPMLPRSLARYRLSLCPWESRPCLVLRTRISPDGEIKNCSLRSELVRINCCVGPWDPCPDDVEFAGISNALSRRYGLPHGWHTTMKTFINICVYFTREASCQFAEENSLPLYYKTQTLKPLPKRLVSLERRGKSLQESVYSAVKEIIGDDGALRSYCRSCLPPDRHILEGILFTKPAHGPVRPGPDSCPPAGMQSSFVSPLRRYDSLATVLSWSRIIRGRTDAGIPGRLPSSILRNIFLSGVYYDQDLFLNDKDFWVSEDRLYFDLLNGRPSIKLRESDTGTRIKGIDLKNGRLILG